LIEKHFNNSKFSLPTPLWMKGGFVECTLSPTRWNKNGIEILKTSKWSQQNV